MLSGIPLKWGKPPNSLSCLPALPIPFQRPHCSVLDCNWNKKSNVMKDSNQEAFPPVSKSQLMFSSPKFVPTSSYKHEKGERNYNKFLSYNHKHFKSIQYRSPYNCKVKKVIPITLYFMRLFHPLLPSPTASHNTYCKDETKVMKNVFWAALDSYS